MFLLVAFCIRKKQDLKARAAHYKKQGATVEKDATNMLGSVELLSLPDDYLTEERVKTSTFRSLSELGFDKIAKKRKRPGQI